MEEIQKIIPAIVKISTSLGTGSGFYVKDADVIITNFHVIEGHRSVAVETQNKKKYVANVMLVDADLDIALLRMETPIEEMPTLSLDETQNITNMDRVSVLGFPFGMPFTITEGIISSVEQVLENKKYIQTDAAVNPGNSGGPLVNAVGDVIGLTTSKFTNADNVGFALPVHHVKKCIALYQENAVDRYSVKCGSCDALLTEPEEYCESCGAEIQVQKMFLEQTQSPLGEFVENSFNTLGMNPVLARSGQDRWEFHQGSALIRAFAYDNNHLYIVSPLVDLPKQNLEELYRYLLSNPIHPYYLSLFESTILLSYRIYLMDLSNDSFFESAQQEIVGFIQKADELDNILIEKYGCVPSQESNFPE